MNLSPLGNYQFYDIQGDLLVGGLIYTYEAGTTTPIETYGDVDGATIHSNPIMLNSYGMTGAPIWLQDGFKYKLVIHDAENNLLWTYDDISGINDATELNTLFGSEWILSGVPTYITNDSFFMAGDQTGEFHFGRRLKFEEFGFSVYGSIIKSEFDVGTDRTTITMKMDGSEVLTENVLAVSYGALAYSPQSYPNFLAMAQWTKRGEDLALIEGVIDAWDITGNYNEVTGTGEVYNFGDSFQEGATKYLRFLESGVVLKNNENIKTPKGVDLALVKGDIIEVFAGKDKVNYVALIMSNKPKLIPTYVAPLQVRQTVLTGPSEIQIGNSPTTPYYEIPPFAMTTNSQNGWLAIAYGMFWSGDQYAWTVFNKVFSRTVDPSVRNLSQGYIQLNFPEIYIIDKFTFGNNTSSYNENTDYLWFYTSLDGATWSLAWQGNVDYLGQRTYNIALREAKYLRLVGDNYKDDVHDWECNEFVVYGYKKSDIIPSTVTSISESIIGEIQYTKTSPIMSSPTQDGHTVTVSGEVGVNYGWKAFDNTTTGYWEVSAIANAWIQMQFPNPVNIGRIVLTSASTNANEMPSEMHIEGSVNGTNWVLLGSWINMPIWVVNETQNFDFNNIEDYSYYRLTIDKNQGGVKIIVGELSLNSIVSGNLFGHSVLNFSETQTIVTISDGFNEFGQIDFTYSVPMNNIDVPITMATRNFIYARRDILSGEITYESKNFPPIYGLYQADYSEYLPNLLRGDGVDGSPAIIDSYGSSVTTSGTVINSTTDPKFGTSSILFSSAGSQLKLPRKMGISRTVWTIDFWWKPTSLSGTLDLISTDPGYSILLRYISPKLSLYISSNGSSWDVASNIQGTKTNFTVGTWYYIKVAWLGRRYMVFVDGIKDIQTLSTLNNTQITSLNLGKYGVENNTPIGFIDEFRFRPGLGEYYESATPDLPLVAPTYIKPWIFNINEMKGFEKEEDGTLTNVQMLCIGEFTSNSLTAFTGTSLTYAYNGRKQIAWSSFDPAVDSWLDIPHNIGTDLIILDLNINAPTAVAPYNNQSVIPLKSLGMVSGVAPWSGIPLGRIIDRNLIKIRYPANASADYVGAYGGSGLISSITTGAINISGVITRGF